MEDAAVTPGSSVDCRRQDLIEIEKGRGLGDEHPLKAMRSCLKTQQKGSSRMDEFLAGPRVDPETELRFISMSLT
jgi:hypothetical protein